MLTYRHYDYFPARRTMATMADVHYANDAYFNRGGIEGMCLGPRGVCQSDNGMGGCAARVSDSFMAYHDERKGPKKEYYNGNPSFGTSSDAPFLEGLEVLVKDKSEFTLRHRLPRAILYKGNRFHVLYRYGMYGTHIRLIPADAAAQRLYPRCKEQPAWRGINRRKMDWARSYGCPGLANAIPVLPRNGHAPIPPNGGKQWFRNGGFTGGVGWEPYYTFCMSKVKWNTCLCKGCGCNPLATMSIHHPMTGVKGMWTKGYETIQQAACKDWYVKMDFAIRTYTTLLRGAIIEPKTACCSPWQGGKSRRGKDSACPGCECGKPRPRSQCKQGHCGAPYPLEDARSCSKLLCNDDTFPAKRF